MAKGLRASVKKNNKSKLRSKVFGPVVDARTERLSAKLLELAQQAKPAKSEMEVDSEKGMTNEPFLSLAVWTPSHSLPTESTTTEAVITQQLAEGSSYDVAFPIPLSLSDTESDSGGEDAGKQNFVVNEEDDDEAIFYQVLGLCTDVLGFDDSGEPGGLLMRYDEVFP